MMIKFDWRVPNAVEGCWSLTVYAGTDDFNIYVDDSADFKRRSEYDSFNDLLSDMKEYLLDKIDGFSEVEARTYNNDYTIHCVLSTYTIEKIKKEFYRFVGEIQENRSHSFHGPA